MSSMEGKVIAITGGASGIGLATAQLLASRGARVSIADVQEKALDEASSAIRSATPTAEVFTCHVDVRKTETVVKWIDETIKRFGRLDGAANMAGVFKATESVAATEDAVWDFMMDINAKGLMHCMKAQLPHLKAGGSIVNAASILAITGSGGASAYSASKHAVLGLTRSTAKEVGPKGVRVNCIAPGYIETPMLKAAGEGSNAREGGSSSVPLGRMGQPEEVAFLIAFLLSHEASFITGACYSIDGGWNC